MKEGFFQAVGLHTGTEDQEFDGRLSKFLHFSKDLEKLNASMIMWLECLDVMCASTVCISENISRFCENNDDGEPLKHVAHAFSAVEGDINNTLRKTVKLVFTDRCIKPIEAILSIVPLINAKVQDRKNLLLDHDFYKSKLQSEMAAGKDNNHPVIIKVSNKLSEVSKSLEGATSIIVEVVDEVLSFQPKMLQPEIAAMLACMYTLSSSTTSMLEKLLPLVPQSASTSCLLASLIQSDKLPHNEIVRTVREKLSAETSITPVYARPGALGGTAGGYGYIEFGSIHNLTHPSSHVTAARPVSVSSPSPNSTSNSTSVPAYVKAASTNRAISSRQTPIKLGASPGRPQSQDVDAVKVPLLPKADKEDKIKRRSQCIASAGHSSQGRPAQDHDLDHDIDPGEGGGEDKSQTLTSSSMSSKFAKILLHYACVCGVCLVLDLT